MYQDEIISEVWTNREAYARKHKHNLHSMICDLQKRQKKPLSKVVDRRKKADLAVGEEPGSYKSE